MNFSITAAIFAGAIFSAIIGMVTTDAPQNTLMWRVSPAFFVLSGILATIWFGLFFGGFVATCGFFGCPK